MAGNDLPVLQGLDLEIAGQGITVIVGASGCGKTTLLRILGGFEQPGSGTLDIPVGIKMGMVFQEPRLMPWLTTWKNITFGLRRPDPNAIQSLIDMVGLTGFEKAWSDQLSGGMQQRAALARALAYDPDMILMDEPFAALDYFTREAMQKELLRIHGINQKSIVFVTHSIDEALLLGQQIVVLGGGIAKKTYDLSALPYARNILSDPMINIKRDILKTIEG